MKTLKVILLSLIIPLISFAQSVGPEVIASAGDYYEGANVSLSWTLGELATETYSNGNIILTQGFQQVFSVNITGINLDLLVYLEGPYNTSTGSMNTDLLTSNYLPVNQPYNPALPYYDNSSPVWQYAGTENVATIPSGVVDWVVVQLRDASTPENATSATIIGTQAAFLKEDGSVVGLDGASNIQFTSASFSQNLYAVIFHRNHLGIMSANPLTSSGGVYSYDFSTDAEKVFGGINGYKLVDSNVWAMVAGDGNASGIIGNTDETSVWKPELGTSGYIGSDFDLNGISQNTDETNYWKPNLNAGGQVPAKSNNTAYKSQVPE
jgi:hypothetical protein